MTANLANNIEMLEDFDTTPSLEELGIRPTVQPNVEKIEKLRKLYSSPQENIRVWISWLIKVTIQAKKWYEWLDRRIIFVQTILNLVTGEYFRKLPKNINGKKIQCENELREKRKDETVPDGDEKKPPQLRGEINRIEDDEEEPLSPQTRAAVNEKLNEATVQPHQWIDEENSGEVLGTLDAFNKIPWSIGVPWAPQVFDKKKRKKYELKHLQSVKKIELPKTKKELTKVMKQMKHEAIVYRSLYKHWKEITNQARKPVMHRQVMATENNITHDKIPHFFYLYYPPNIDSAIKRYGTENVLTNLPR